MTAAEMKYLRETHEAIERALHITVQRVGWLCQQAAKTATEDEMDELERFELASMLDTALFASPANAALARRSLDALKLSAPDFPDELTT